MECTFNKNIINQLQLKKNVGKGLIVTAAPSAPKNKNQTVYLSEHPLEHFSEYHTHSFFEINYVFKGSCINLLEDEVVEMNTGDLAILHPGTFHTLYADGESLIYNFIVSKEWFDYIAQKIMPGENLAYSFFERVCKEDYYKYVVFPCSNNSSDVSASAERLIEANQNNSICKYILLESAMLELLSVLIANSQKAFLSPGRGSKDYKLINILMYMAENYSTVTLEEISDKFFYSKTHICRIFTQNTGKTFNQTLMQMKINHACILLKTTDFLVEDIARMIGYDSCEYFQRLFKKTVGMTPGNFRKIGEAYKLLC